LKFKNLAYRISFEFSLGIFVGLPHFLECLQEFFTHHYFVFGWFAQAENLFGKILHGSLNVFLAVVESLGEFRNIKRLIQSGHFCDVMRFFSFFAQSENFAFTYLNCFLFEGNQVEAGLFLFISPNPVDSFVAG
jgi:hypothetical protein